MKAEPSPRRTFLGFVIDTTAGTIQVSGVRAQEFATTLLDICRRPRHVPARLLSRATGQLASMGRAVGAAGRIFSRELHAVLATRWSWRSHLVMSQPSLKEIQFWQQHFDSHNSSALWPDTKVENLRLWSDAGDNGWGGHATDGNSCFAYLQGYFRPGERGPISGSTYRELLALERCLLSLPRLAGQKTRAFVDSRNLEYIWHTGSRLSHLNDIAKRIFWLCQRRGIRLAIEWIPREENQLADYMSKFFDGDYWQLHLRVFTELNDRWGPHTIDRFSSYLNNHCPRFNSLFYCPGTDAVDAFSQNWANENNWINPPFGLVGQVIVHLRRCRATATLVCPVWPKRPWWPLVCRDGLFPDYVVDWVELTMSHDLFLPGATLSHRRGIGNARWRVLALRIDFSTARP